MKMPPGKTLAVLLTLLAGAAAAEESARAITLYKTAGSAACSRDVTVWLDPATRVFYLKGEKGYGKTARGGYNCRRQAEAAGYRAAKPR
jgi:hypothetical protein